MQMERNKKFLAHLTEIFEFGDYKPRMSNYNNQTMAQKAEEKFIMMLNSKAKHILKMEFEAMKLRSQNDIVTN